jgi:hypothetical protein
MMSGTAISGFQRLRCLDKATAPATQRQTGTCASRSTAHDARRPRRGQAAAPARLSVRARALDDWKKDSWPSSSATRSCASRHPLSDWCLLSLRRWAVRRHGEERTAGGRRGPSLDQAAEGLQPHSAVGSMPHALACVDKHPIHSSRIRSSAHSPTCTHKNANECSMRDTIPAPDDASVLKQAVPLGRHRAQLLPQQCVVLLQAGRLFGQQVPAAEHAAGALLAEHRHIPASTPPGVGPGAVRRSAQWMTGWAGAGARPQALAAGSARRWRPRCGTHDMQAPHCAAWASPALHVPLPLVSHVSCSDAGLLHAHRCSCSFSVRASASCWRS